MLGIPAAHHLGRRRCRSQGWKCLKSTKLKVIFICNVLQCVGVSPVSSGGKACLANAQWNRKGIFARLICNSIWWDYWNLNFGDQIPVLVDEWGGCLYSNCTLEYGWGWGKGGGDICWTFQHSPIFPNLCSYAAKNIDTWQILNSSRWWNYGAAAALEEKTHSGEKLQKEKCFCSFHFLAFKSTFSSPNFLWSIS